MDKEILVKKLMAASISYYNSGQTIMSDAEFDQLKVKLQAIDPDHSFLKQVGVPPSNILNKIKHIIPMGSLNNSNNAEEYRKWHAKHNQPVVASHKLDGASLALIYQDGVLLTAGTRGSGEIGEDITDNVKQFKNVPLLLEDNFTGSIRGEALLFLEDFEEHFPGGTNARNVGNGTMRRKSGEGNEHMRFVAFDVLSENVPATSHVDALAKLSELGFDVVEHRLCQTADEVIALYEEITAARLGFPYLVDGVVVRVNDNEIFPNMGERDNRPKGATAFKFVADEAVTTLRQVVLSVGHTGVIAPTGKLEPVHIGGVTVESVFLNNFEEIDRLGIALGDTIVCYLAGAIIPKIDRVSIESPNRTPIPIPTHCPACNSELVKDGVHLFCRNDDCDAKQEGKVKSWVKKRKILYFGDSIRKYLFEQDIVTQPHQLYELDEGELAQIPVGNGKLGAKRAASIIEEINKSRTATLAEFIGSLGTDMLGRRQMVHIVNFGFDTLDKVLDMTVETLADNPGFTENKAGRIVAGIQKARPEIEALRPYITIEEAEEAPAPTEASGVLTGVYCFTGKILREDETGNRYTRSIMQDLVIRNGGTVANKVQAGTTHLVLVDIDSQSSKAKKARKIGIRLISEEEFFTSIGL